MQTVVTESATGTDRRRYKRPLRNQYDSISSQSLKVTLATKRRTENRQHQKIPKTIKLGLYFSSLL